MTTVIDTPAGIAGTSLLVLKHRLRMEARGLKFRGRSTLSIAKGYGYRGTTAKVAELVSRDADAHADYFSKLQAGATPDKLHLAWDAISEAGAAFLLAHGHPTPIHGHPTHVTYANLHTPDEQEPTR